MSPRSICLLVITDGREDYYDRTLKSASQALPLSGMSAVKVDDSDHELGFGGAIQQGWREVLAETDATHIFHLEADFTFNRPVPVLEMAAALDAHPHLVQLALRRQPWNDHEKAAGGIVEMAPDDYTEVRWNGVSWLEHTRNFTTNPCLYPRWVCEAGWPDGAESEGRFGFFLRERHPDLRFGYWGARDSGEWVTHIGEVRSGRGY